MSLLTRFMIWAARPQAAPAQTPQVVRDTFEVSKHITPRPTSGFDPLSDGMIALEAQELLLEPLPEPAPEPENGIFHGPS